MRLPGATGTVKRRKHDAASKRSFSSDEALASALAPILKMVEDMPVTEKEPLELMATIVREKQLEQKIREIAKTYPEVVAAEATGSDANELLRVQREAKKDALDKAFAEAGVTALPDEKSRQKKLDEQRASPLFKEEGDHLVNVLDAAIVLLSGNKHGPLWKYGELRGRTGDRVHSITYYVFTCYVSHFVPFIEIHLIVNFVFLFFFPSRRESGRHWLSGRSSFISAATARVRSRDFRAGH